MTFCGVEVEEFDRRKLTKKNFVFIFIYSEHNYTFFFIYRQNNQIQSTLNSAQNAWNIQHQVCV